MHRVTPRKRQRGISLLDALLAFLVLVLGILGAARLQGHLRLNADISRQRTEALRLAQEDIESLRGFASIAPTPSQPSYADIVSGSKTVGNNTGYKSNTSFQIERSVATAAGFRTAAVSVAWDDRPGQPQQVLLQSVIAATPPALSGALSARPAGQPVKGVRGRPALVPWMAKDLGNGSSAFKPVEAGTVAFVLSNAGGAVTSICTGIAAATQTSGLSSVDLSHCTAISGLLLSGIVRNTSAVPPDPANAADTPLPLTIAMTMSKPGAAAPICLSEARMLPSGDRFVAYHCVVPMAQGSWSGRSAVVPQGWTLGSTAADRRVCRYSADQDGSGGVDQNAEHPDQYENVDRNLMQQNFLIVRGDQGCPAAAAASTPLAANFATVQHQP